MRRTPVNDVRPGLANPWEIHTPARFNAKSIDRPGLTLLTTLICMPVGLLSITDPDKESSIWSECAQVFPSNGSIAVCLLHRTKNKKKLPFIKSKMEGTPCEVLHIGPSLEPTHCVHRPLNDTHFASPIWSTFIWSTGILFSTSLVDLNSNPWFNFTSRWFTRKLARYAAAKVTCMLLTQNFWKPGPGEKPSVGFNFKGAKPRGGSCRERNPQARGEYPMSWRWYVCSRSEIKYLG